MKTSSTIMFASAVALFAATSSFAATVNPDAFDRVFTEGQRTATVDGSDATGANSSVSHDSAGQVNIGALDAGSDVLIVGRVKTKNNGFNGSDSFLASPVNGPLTVSILNYASSSRSGTATFAALFELLVDNTLVQSIELGGVKGQIFDGIFGTVSGNTVEIRVNSRGGASDYDISFVNTAAPVTIAPPAAVPLPAAGFLLLGGLGGIAAMRRRRKTA